MKTNYKTIKMMIPHDSMKINDLFGFIANQVKSHEERQSLYRTVREIIKFRKELHIRNNVNAMLSKYTAIFTYFMENYNSDESEVHNKNLDAIHDMYYMFSDSDDEDYIVNSDEDSESDTDSMKKDKIYYNHSNMRQHRKTQWWLSGLTLLQVAQVTLTGYMFMMQFCYF